MSSNQPPRSAGEEMSFDEMVPTELVIHDDEKTANLLRRAKERATAENAPVQGESAGTDWRQVGRDVLLQIAESRGYQIIASRIGRGVEGCTDWVFGFLRWCGQRKATRQEQALLCAATSAARRAENIWQRARRFWHNERVEVIRFVRDAPSNTERTLTYSLERGWTTFGQVKAHNLSYGMATIAIHRFGRVTVSIRNVELCEVGLKIRMTRRKGLTIFRLEDESGDIALLTEAIALLLLSQYQSESNAPCSLKELAGKLEHGLGEPSSRSERNVYQPSTSLTTQIQEGWQALRERKLLRGEQPPSS